MTERERCHVCDAPLVTWSDAVSFSTTRPAGLCWSRWPSISGYGEPEHAGPPVDWRARARSAEAICEATARFLDLLESLGDDSEEAHAAKREMDEILAATNSNQAFVALAERKRLAWEALKTRALVAETWRDEYKAERDSAELTVADCWSKIRELERERDDLARERSRSR